MCIDTTLGQAAITRLSLWVDQSPANAARDPEARTWGRLAKIIEEAGEVVAAWIAHTGQNPRKPAGGPLADVRHELLDVALTALSAYEHLTGDGLALVALCQHALRADHRAAADREPANV